MPYSQGINFRATAGYVTDPAGYDVILNGTTNAYPYATAQGNTVGWESATDVFGLDRDSANIAQLAGLNFVFGTDRDFRLDLPSPGQYLIRLAAGDAVSPNPCAISLYDSASLVTTMSTGTTSTTNYFKDATDAEWSNTAWAGSNVAITPTFTTTICRFRLLGTVSLSVIASLYIEKIVKPWYYYAQQQ